MEFAESVVIRLIDNKKNVKELRFDGSKENYMRYDLSQLSPTDIEKLLLQVAKWKHHSYGLFLDKFSIIVFAMIVEKMFNDKYKIEYEWIGGADPYKAWKEEQDNAPKDAIY